MDQTTGIVSHVTEAMALLNDTLQFHLTAAVRKPTEGRSVSNWHPPKHPNKHNSMSKLTMTPPVRCPPRACSQRRALERHATPHELRCKALAVGYETAFLIMPSTESSMTASAGRQRIFENRNVPCPHASVCPHQRLCCCGARRLTRQQLRKQRARDGRRVHRLCRQRGSHAVTFIQTQ